MTELEYLDTVLKVAEEMARGDQRLWKLYEELEEDSHYLYDAVAMASDDPINGNSELARFDVVNDHVDEVIDWFYEIDGKPVTQSAAIRFAMSTGQTGALHPMDLELGLE